MENSKFFMIPNEYQDAKCRIRIPGQARQVLDVIERFTFGWNKREASISYMTFRKMTGLDDRNILRARKKLIKMGVVDPVKNVRLRNTSYRIQMDYTKWKPLSKMSPTKNVRLDPVKNVRKSLSKKTGLQQRPIKDINVKYNSINTVKPSKPKISHIENEYEKIREKKIDELQKKYRPEFDKAVKTKNLEWVENINNKIKEELAEFSHKFHLRKKRVE